jgi:hypothetical protein
MIWDIKIVSSKDRKSYSKSQKRNVSINESRIEMQKPLRQSTIFFIVSVLVLIWFGAEAFPGQEICVTSCISLKGMNIAEEVATVAILPILIVLGGFSLRRSEKEKEIAGRTSPKVSEEKKEPHSIDEDSTDAQR